MSIRTAFLERHPEIFKGKPPPSWAIPDAWVSLLDELCHQLAEVLPPDELACLEFSDFKEKYGCLSIHYWGGNDTVCRLVDAVETRSEKVCQECGEPGVVRERAWVVTLCAFCLRELALRESRRG